MVAASSAPAGAGSVYTTLGRRTSARQARRRPTDDGGPSMAPSHQSQSNNPDDSTSDLEILHPMKLSALTKALLGDRYGSDASTTAPPPAPRGRSPRNTIPAPVHSAYGDQEPQWKRTSPPPSRPASPSHRPPSRIRTRKSSVPGPVHPTSGDQESFSRGAAAQAGGGPSSSSRHPSPAGSRDNSPAPRKRVVRLSNANSAGGAYNSSFSGGGQRNSLRNSLSASTREKRPGSADGRRERNSEPPVGQQEPSAKTPVVAVRTVRIAVGSSGQKSASGGSSDARSRGITRSSDREARNGPAAIPAPAPSAAAPQTSTRVKRVGKTPGSFLSGPARRGRRRQSEEDADGQSEPEAFGLGHESGSQQPQSRQEQQVASSAASEYPDFAASGSPVSARDSARAALRRHKSTFITPVGQRKSEHDHRPLAYRIPSPPAPESASEDKENEAPSEIAPVIPATIRTTNPSPFISSQKAPSQPLAPANAGAVEVRQAYAPPDSHILAARSHNVPQRPAPPPPPKMSVVETATSAAGASTTVQASKKRQFLLRVNGKTYTRIDSLGRGGSGKVYRVSAENGKLLALKRVSLDNLDERVIKGYQGEIDLLQRLAGVNRVIQLIDHEFNAEKKMLSIVLEAGELDFNTFLRSRTSEDSRFDPVFVRYWWKEMVECVQAVHGKDIIHTDLKPANFVLAQGQLKVIDFGIANAIQTDMTVNVHRDAQIGTPNYMSPESLMDSSEYAMTSAYKGQFNAPPLQRPKHFKLGKASDIWSLGCILYQMVYGQCPFAKITNMMARVNAIKDWSHTIDFPEHTEHGVRVPPSLIRTLRRCLNRDQTQRPTCDELLSPTDPFLYPLELSPAVFAAADHGQVIPITPELLRDVVWNVVKRCRQDNPSDAEALDLWPQAYWASCKKMLAGSNGSAGGRNEALR